MPRSTKNRLGQHDFTSSSTYSSSLSQIRSSKYAGINSTSSTLVDPVKAFPRRRDGLGDVYVARDARAAVRLFEETAPYLQVRLFSFPVWILRGA